MTAQEKYETVLRMRIDGANNEHIAAAIGMSRSWVQYAASRMRKAGVHVPTSPVGKKPNSINFDALKAIAENGAGLKAV